MGHNTRGETGQVELLMHTTSTCAATSDKCRPHLGSLIESMMEIMFVHHGNSPIYVTSKALRPVIVCLGHILNVIVVVGWSGGVSCTYYMWGNVKNKKKDTSLH